MNICEDASIEFDSKIAKIVDRVQRGRTVKLTNRFEDGRLVATFKPGRGAAAHDCKVSVRIALYEGTATAAAAKQDGFVNLTAAGDAVAAAFIEKLTQMCAQPAPL